MDTETEVTEWVRPVPPPEQLERWLLDRVDQRAEFLRSCIAWAVPRGGEMWWPEDRAALLELGIPCDDCATVVHQAVDELHAAPARGEHWLIVTAVGGAGHWSDGIVAKCGQPPAWPVEVGA